MKDREYGVLRHDRQNFVRNGFSPDRTRNDRLRMTPPQKNPYSACFGQVLADAAWNGAIDVEFH
jgi:hypothetical protein